MGKYSLKLRIDKNDYNYFFTIDNLSSSYTLMIVVTSESIEKQNGKIKIELKLV